MNLFELFVEVGFKADTIKLKEFMHAVGELNLSSVAGAVGLGTLYEATKKIMEAADKTAMSVFRYTQVTGKSGKEMQQFSNYAKEIGLSADEAQGALDGLSKTLFKVKLGQASPMPFVLAGMNPGEKDPIKSLQQLQDYIKATKELDPEMHRFITEDLGVADSMLMVLKASGRLTDEIEKQPFASPEELEKIHKYRKALADLGTHIDLLFTRWGASLVPVVKHLDSLASKMLEILRTGEGWKSLFTEIEQIFQKMIPLVGALRLIGAGLKIAEKNIEKNFKFIMSAPTPPSVALAGAGNTTTNQFDISVSGVQDPEKASDLVTKKLEKLFSDRFYHEKVQER